MTQNFRIPNSLKDAAYETIFLNNLLGSSIDKTKLKRPRFAEEKLRSIRLLALWSARETSICYTG